MSQETQSSVKQLRIAVVTNDEQLKKSVREEKVHF